MPPAVRVASVTGGRTAVGHFTEAVAQRLARRGSSCGTAGPAPLALGAAAATGGPGPRRPEDTVRAEADVRTLLFIPYAQAQEVTKVLRAVKAASAAKRSDDPVQLRLDGVDVL